MINNVTIGSDVEFFLLDKHTQEIVSAEGLVKGTKWEPFRFYPGDRYFATQLDNVLAEGNIPPAKTEAQFVSYLGTLREYIDTTLPEHLRTTARAAARLHDKYLQTRNAKTFGCDPSWNCWTMEIEPVHPTDPNLRSAGFHIHVGYDSPNEETSVALARAMDLYLGVPSVTMEPPNERRTVGYGKAGNFRIQAHGVEYRSLSSWFAGRPERIEWAYKNTMKAIDTINRGETDFMQHGALIMDTINTENKTTAYMLMQKFGIDSHLERAA